MRIAATMKNDSFNESYFYICVYIISGFSPYKLICGVDSF